MSRRTRHPRRILLAEDNALNRELVLTLLGRWGHTVITASTGHEALAAFEREHCDLVLMDLQMPELDGIEATIAIRKSEGARGRRVPIIAMTAVDSQRARCLAAGMDGFTSRPVNAAQLFDLIEHAVAGSAPELDGLEATAAIRAREQETGRHQRIIPMPRAEVTPESPVIDTAELLERTADDAELVREMVRLFRATYPELLSELRGAVERSDEALLARTAHNLRGSIGILAAPAALHAVERLEFLGRSADVAEGRTACDRLEMEIRRLEVALERFA